MITTGVPSLWMGWFLGVALRLFPGGLAHSLLLQALHQLWGVATSFHGSLSFLKQLELIVLSAVKKLDQYNY